MDWATALPSGRSRRASRRSATTTFRSIASANSAAFTPRKPPTACLSPIAPAIAACEVPVDLVQDEREEPRGGRTAHLAGAIDAFEMRIHVADLVRIADRL